MRKNVASQVAPGVHLRSATDGSAVTSGTTTVYITGDNGTQAAGGTAVHKGNGFWTYAPSQAETNYTVVMFTYVNASAMSESVTVYTVGQDFTAAQLAANVTQISGDSTAADNLEAAADGTSYNLGGGAIVAASVTAEVTANVSKISGDSVAADNAESFFDGTGYVGTNNTIPTVTNVTNGVTVTTNSDKTGYSLTPPYDPAKTAAQAGDAMTLANDSVTAAAIADDALAAIKAELEAVIATTNRAELAAVPAANAPFADKMNWVFMLLRNRRVVTATEETLYADDGTTPIATSDVTAASGTLTRGEYTNVP